MPIFSHGWGRSGGLPCEGRLMEVCHRPPGAGHGRVYGEFGSDPPGAHLPTHPAPRSARPSGRFVLRRHPRAADVNAVQIFSRRRLRMRMRRCGPHVARPRPQRKPGGACGGQGHVLVGHPGGQISALPCVVPGVCNLRFSGCCSNSARQFLS